MDDQRNDFNAQKEEPQGAETPEVDGLLDVSEEPRANSHSRIEDFEQRVKKAIGADSDRIRTDLIGVQIVGAGSPVVSDEDLRKLSATPDIALSLLAFLIVDFPLVLIVEGLDLKDLYTDFWSREPITWLDNLLPALLVLTLFVIVLARVMKYIPPRYLLPPLIFYLVWVEFTSGSSQYSSFSPMALRNWADMQAAPIGRHLSKITPDTWYMTAVAVSIALFMGRRAVAQAIVMFQKWIGAFVIVLTLWLPVTAKHPVRHWFQNTFKVVTERATSEDTWRARFPSRFP